jgi:hypothetical protein
MNPIVAKVNPTPRHEGKIQLPDESSSESKILDFVFVFLFDS